MSPKRNSYTSEFKLKMIKSAAENNNGAAESLETETGQRLEKRRENSDSYEKIKKANHGLNETEGTSP